MSVPARHRQATNVIPPHERLPLPPPERVMGLTRAPASPGSPAVERSLSADVLTGWAAREALADRGDDLAVRDLLIRAGHAVFGAVLALNGIYLPHRIIKWQSHLVSELDVMPGHFAERLGLLATSGNTQALREAETLLADTV